MPILCPQVARTSRVVVKGTQCNGTEQFCSRVPCVVPTGTITRGRHGAVNLEKAHTARTLSTGALFFTNASPNRLCSPLGRMVEVFPSGSSPDIDTAELPLQLIAVDHPFAAGKNPRAFAVVACSKPHLTTSRDSHSAVPASTRRGK